MPILGKDRTMEFVFRGYLSRVNLLLLVNATDTFITFLLF